MSFVDTLTSPIHQRALRIPALGAAALTLIAALSLAVFTLLSPGQARAHDDMHKGVHHGDLLLIDAWARATPPGAKVGGGYLMIRNEGDAPDRLIGGTVAFAERVEIHEMKMEGEVMKMAPLPDGLEIPAGGAVMLKPGGYHLMFMGLSQPLTEDEPAAVTLTFERAGTIEIPFAVAPMGAKSHDHGMKHDG